MIPFLILLTFFPLSLQKTDLNHSKISLQSTIIHTPNSISDYTIQKGNKNYLIGNPNNYLSSDQDLTSSNSFLYDIYYAKNIKTFIYIVNDMSFYSSDFLSNVAHSIGYKFDFDSSAKNYLLIIFAIKPRKYFYRLGENVKKKISESTVANIIQNHKYYLQIANYNNLIYYLTNSLKNSIINNISVNVKSTSKTNLDGIVIVPIIFIIIIFGVCLSCCAKSSGSYRGDYSARNSYASVGGGYDYGGGGFDSGGGGFDSGSVGGGGSW
jgi:hypothetical protein